MPPKKYHKVVEFRGSRKTYMKFGWVENPTFKNDIYVDTKSAHKGGSGFYELRTDEALLYIQGLAMALNSKMGVKLEKLIK